MKAALTTNFCREKKKYSYLEKVSTAAHMMIILARGCTLSCCHFVMCANNDYTHSNSPLMIVINMVVHHHHEDRGPHHFLIDNWQWLYILFTCNSYRNKSIFVWVEAENAANVHVQIDSPNLSLISAFPSYRTFCTFQLQLLLSLTLVAVPY